MTAILSSRRPPASKAAISADADDRRERLRQAIRSHEAQAQQAAEQGDLAQAARLILAALDGERRMAATGPQVLQVIKPRG
jgi:hypothetical protein